MQGHHLLATASQVSAGVALLSVLIIMLMCSMVDWLAVVVMPASLSI